MTTIPSPSVTSEPKTIFVSGTSITFVDPLDFHAWLDQQDYISLQLDPASPTLVPSGGTHYALDFDDLQPGANYLPVSRRIHNATMGVDASTLSSIHAAREELEQDIKDAYTAFKRDASESAGAMAGGAYQQMKDDIRATWRECKREMYHGMFVIALFIILCLIIYFTLHTVSAVTIHRITTAKTAPTTHKVKSNSRQNE